MKKTAVVIIGVMLSLFISGTALADLNLDLANPDDRQLLADLISEKTGMEFPVEALPMVPVILTLVGDIGGGDPLKVTIEVTKEAASSKDVSEEVLAKLVDIAHEFLPKAEIVVERPDVTMVDLSDFILPKISEMPEPPEAPEAPEMPETPEAPELPETPEAPDKPAVPEAPEKVTGLENAIMQSHQNAGKEVGNGGVLQAREGRPGMEVIRSHETPDQTHALLKSRQEVMGKKGNQAPELHMPVENSRGALSGRALMGR